MKGRTHICTAPVLVGCSRKPGSHPIDHGAELAQILEDLELVDLLERAAARIRRRFWSDQ